MIVVASYGGGVNSTAMLIECSKKKLQVDLILFADTGGEKPHTYAYLDTFDAWLIEQGMPGITRVKKGGIQETLEENCHRMHMLPSLAYGFKGCSHKFKKEPQEKYVNNWQPARKEWREGRKVVKLIGIDADEAHRAKIPGDKKYHYLYPLIRWDMGRDECLETIKEAGLCVPGKSACFFCPSSKKREILELKRMYPDLADRAIAMEEGAELTSVKGLGRRFAWKDFLASAADPDATEESHIDLVCGCYDG